MPEFSSKRHSFFIKREAPSEEAISSGFRWLLQNLAEENKKLFFLAVPSLDYLQGTILSILGEPAVRALETKGRMNFNKAFLRLVTINNTSSFRTAESPVVLALYPDDTLLEILDSNSTISSILAVPQHFSQIKYWALKWNALDLETLKPLTQ